MIIDPDFLDHWRTRMLVDALNDEMAPFYVMRIWSHCQLRKGSEFDMPPAGLRAICRAAPDASMLEAALVECGFVERDGPTIKVPKWADHNSSLIAAWANGVNGGRPKKAPTTVEKATEITQEKPTGNPAETHGLPVANPKRTQTKPIGEEKRREEEENPPTPLDLDAREVLTYLNVKAEKSYQPADGTLKPIRARLAEGARVETLKAVIDSRVEAWKDSPKMHEFLRPATLFGPDKFAGYVGGLPKVRRTEWWVDQGYGTKNDALANGATEPA